MTYPHPLGILTQDQKKIEAVGAKYIKEGLIYSRAKTIEVLNIIRTQIKEGMTEFQARELALKIFADFGVSKHWHRPYIRFGAGTTLTFHDPLQTDYKLKDGDPFYIDLGPVWMDKELDLEYEGDYGETFVLGSNIPAQKCADYAHQLFDQAKEKWKTQQLNGLDLYQFIKDNALSNGYHLVDKVNGHRVADFPHHRYSKERLAGLPFTPQDTIWVLEIQINDPSLRFGAFFEDLL